MRLITYENSLLNRLDHVKYDRLVQDYDFKTLLDNVKVSDIAHALISKVSFNNSHSPFPLGQKESSVCRNFSDSCLRPFEVLSRDQLRKYISKNNNCNIPSLLMNDL